MKLLRLTIAPFCFALLLSGSGCAQEDSLQKKYGASSDYFIALSLLKDDNTQQAIRHLKIASKKATPLISRKALEKLAETGNLQERLAGCRQLHKNFNDGKSLLVYAEELYRQKEYYSIISLTDSLDYETAKDKLCYFRLKSMLEKKDSRTKNEFHKWLLSCPYSEWHEKFFSEYLGTDNNATDTLAQFRSFVFKKNYIAAAEKAGDIVQHKAFNKPVIYSDIGKALLYGSKNFMESAVYMEQLYKNSPKNCRFYCSFYAGRFHEKAGQFEKALEKFSAAMNESENDRQYDNALWYYFNSCLNISLDRTINAIEKFSAQIRDKNYYDDFFETLSLRINSSHRWDLFKTAYDLMEGKASDEICSKYSYITARLIETKKINSQSSEKAKEYFKKALNSGNELYYKILAMEKLDFSIEQAEDELCRNVSIEQESSDSEIEELLYGYADFGLAEFIYPQHEESKNFISSRCSEKMADFLWKCGRLDERYSQESLRIASRKIIAENSQKSKKLYELAYPRRYENFVSSSCADFTLEENILYALIRSESFFNPKAKSNAGAVGLTQLMETTAEETARKLKIENPDILDPETNIKLGSFYFRNLETRLNNSTILAALSYNAGITRVRSWLKSAALESGNGKIPYDLFVEALPYPETREYGRKILSAAAIYGWLYYGISPSETARKIFH